MWLQTRKPSAPSTLTLTPAAATTTFAPWLVYPLQNRYWNASKLNQGDQIGRIFAYWAIVFFG
jgi:hypothetical protein